MKIIQKTKNLGIIYHDNKYIVAPLVANQQATTGEFVYEILAYCDILEDAIKEMNKIQREFDFKSN